MGIAFARWLVAPMLVLTFGLLIVSNLVLQTRAVREWAEGKLERRLGLDVAIRSISWTPWTGIQVRDLTAKIPNLGNAGSSELRPLYDLDVDVQITWGALRGGEIKARELRLRRGVVSIPLELNSLLASERDRAEQGMGRQPGGIGEGGEQGSGKGSQGEKDKPNERPAPPGNEARLPARPAVRLIIDRCDVGVYSVHGKRKEELVLNNLRGELPLRGEDASGWIRHDGLTLGSHPVLKGAEMPVVWSRPFLRLPLRRFVREGPSLEAEGYLRLVGIPRFLLKFNVPAGPVGRIALDSGSGMEVQAGSFEAQGQLQGTLPALHSWRGGFSAEVSALGLHQRQREICQFEYGRVTASMRRGTFRVLDARLRSEQLSLLGNAVLVPDGRVRGVLRLVADSPHAELITRFAVGAMLTGGWTRSWLEPLGTPDRQYRDLHLNGTLNRAMIDVGRHGEELEIRQALGRVVDFVKNEMKEKEQSRVWVPPGDLLP